MSIETPFGGSPVSGDNLHKLEFTGSDPGMVVERHLSHRHHTVLKSIMEGRDSQNAYEHSQVGFEEDSAKGAKDFASLNRERESTKPARSNPRKSSLSNGVEAESHSSSSKRKQAAPKRYVQKPISEPMDSPVSPGRAAARKRLASKEAAEADKKKRSSVGRRRRTSNSGPSGSNTRKAAPKSAGKATRPPKKARMNHNGSSTSPSRPSSSKSADSDEPVTPGRVPGLSMDSLSLHAPMVLDDGNQRQATDPLSPTSTQTSFVEDSFSGTVRPATISPARGQEVRGSPELRATSRLQPRLSASSQPFVPSSRHTSGATAGKIQPTNNRQSSQNLSQPTSVELRRAQQEVLQSRQKSHLLQQTLDQERRSHEESNSFNEAVKKDLREFLIRSLVESAKLEFQEQQRKLAQDSDDYGRAVQLINGTTVWEDGRIIRETKFKIHELKNRLQRLDVHLETIQNMRWERQQQSLDGDFRKPIVLPHRHSHQGNHHLQNHAHHPSEDPSHSDDSQKISFDSLRLQIHTDLLTKRLLRQDLAKLERELTELERSRQRRAREQKILDDQRLSDYNDPSFRLFHDRYVRLNMLGKGGFSEVWKAFDLEELRYVAVKIHRLRREWPEQWRRNYTKHAEREYNIHRSLEHPNVIPLHAVFSIDDFSFCTVLELCGGCDLDMYLKLHHTVPESEARVIIAQVLSGLLYLHSQQKRIIHYDLKPGNILYDQGRVKLADFGLSKQMQNQHDDSIALTSQGAGTPWYLPPECFASGGASISPKVDIWSTGVVLYQLLFGKKPFGDGMSADAVLHRGTITNARSVTFPESSPVSEDSKDFVRQCLTYNHRLRPDASSLLEHKFFAPIFQNSAPQ